jgi:hypothetical protein
MATRRDFIAKAALATAAAPVGSAFAQGGEQIDALFVQSATSMTYDKGSGKLVLRGVSPATIVFSDRPKRLAGHMDTKEFVPFWSEGKDSFAKDPPNATLSIFDEKALTQVVATLRNPVLAGDTLTYEVRVLQGEMPAKGGLVSVFIDIIGMPMTPFSYAGAYRRRAFYYYR